MDKIKVTIEVRIAMKCEYIPNVILPNYIYHTSGKLYTIIPI